MGHLIRTLLVLAVVAIVVAYFLGYLPQTQSVFGSAPTSTAPASQDVEAPRGAPPAKPLSGDDLKGRAARAAQRVDETLAEAALTTKIKAKIALDDTVKSSDVHVHTKDGVVTLTGTVSSEAKQERILQLARETSGVQSVVNEIRISAR
jgi:hyperosmotically inducible periplasmic protein